MMNNRDRGNFDSENQFEYEHPNEQLGTDNQYIAHCDRGPINKRSMKTGISKGNSEERVNADDEDNYLCRSRYVVVDKSATINFIKVGILFSV